MGGPAVLNQFQCLIKLGLRIVGQCQHDVPADVGKACPLGRRERRPGLFGGVGAAQRFELAVPGRLHPERDAVDARGPEAAQCFFGDRLRVGFQCDLRPGPGLGRFYKAGNIARCE